MSKLLIVCPYPFAKAPSQRFRFEQYISAFKEKGADVEISSFWTAAQWPAIYKNQNTIFKIRSTFVGFAKRFFLLFSLWKFDVVFIHREATPIGLPWWEWAAAKIFQKKIVFDFDDAIWLPNVSKANEKLVGKWKNHSKTRKIISWSKTVFAGNEFLANYARKYCSDVRIVPTTIDLELHDFKKKNSMPASETVTIGWTGTHSTLKQLIPLFKTLEEVHKKIPFRFVLIADVLPEKMPPFVEFVKWKKETEITDLAQIDIGIMPLYDTEWEKGKCGFKALQYMALKIPTIVSGVGVNTEIIDHGKNGFIAEPMTNESKVYEQWESFLIKLLKDEPLRNSIGEKGKETIEERFATQVLYKEYVSIISSEK